jgi:hypothetical protein
MKRLVLSSIVVALLVTAMVVVTANAGLVAGSSGSQVIALDDDPNMPLIPEATFIQQQFIAVDADPNDLAE